MMSRHFRLSSELSGAIAKKLPHAKNQLSVPGSFFNQFVTDIYTHKQTLRGVTCIYTYFQTQNCSQIDILYHKALRRN